MSPPERIHEVDFCGQVAADVAVMRAQDPTFPFAEARLEGFGTGAANLKRKDLRLIAPDGTLALCGEVKLPGTPEGRSAFDDRLYQNAAQKADNAGVRFFFTWNVNEFVLWDRSQWEKPPLERRVRAWKLGLVLVSPEDVARPENLDFIRTRFLPGLLRDLADIYTGRRRDWTMPPDDIFIRSLESHLDWPVQLATAYLIDRTARSRPFDATVQQWLADHDRLFVRNDADRWREALRNMAKSLAYVWANRLIFYKALRTRFRELPRLELKRTVKTAADASVAFDRYFQRAEERSGDYEPLLFPNAADWASGVVFEAPNALDAWRGLLRGIEAVNFQDVPSDIVGRIFQKLIGPEERHRYGQHFTGDDVVDLINAFCIRAGTDTVLDPACGSGSFLVRAYYRKQHLDPTRAHVALLADLFGCDIALYPAHLATLNLAAREINDEANYPRIVRRDFFDTEFPADTLNGNGRRPFCTIPDGAGGQQGIQLPLLDAVVGNPPYRRQEKIEKEAKARYRDKAHRSWSNGLQLSGRADLHCYFWPVATKLLKPDGYFGFLTISSWLDVEYGFALQGWMLRHFKVLAVMESNAEPWFTDARVKTVATILQRCDDEAARAANLVRFVRFDCPLREIIGVSSLGEEGEPAPSISQRQRAVERLRDRILAARGDLQDEALRIIVKPQRDLWAEGVRVGTAVRHAPAGGNGGDEEDKRDEDTDADTDTTAAADEPEAPTAAGEYAAGKWGRYVRAPEFYFEIMRRFGSRFVPLGEIAKVSFGIKTGCDDFFMPRDVTQQRLRDAGTETAFRRIAGGAPRKDVVSGKLRIVKAGDGSVHPIETEFLAPEVHSLMTIDRPVVRAKDLDRVVLLVDRPMKQLRGTWVYRYLQYGEQATFLSKKSKAVPVPQRSTCAARQPWYDLTKLVKPGFAFWPMAQQYRHIIAGNPDRLVCNHNLFDLSTEDLGKREREALWAVLNSTLIGLFKTFYGRYAGTEGNLKTEVVDVNLLEVPDARGVDAALAKRLTNAVKAMSRRTVGRLIEEQLMACHSSDRARRIAAGPPALATELQQEDRRALDDAVFELLGVADPAERAQLVQRLYEETARHFRTIRVVEIEKQEQRGRATNRRFSTEELAADIWDAAELADARPLAEWLQQRPECDTDVEVPAEGHATVSRDRMFDPCTVYFGKGRETSVRYQSPAAANLVAYLARQGLSGAVRLPADEARCAALDADVRERLLAARRHFRDLVESRMSDERRQEAILDVLMRWFIRGREGPSSRSAPVE